MPIMFNTILAEAGLPLADVRLLRHKDKRATKGRSPYELWRDDRPQFDIYQSIQSFKNRKKLNAPYWAVFIVNLSDDAMFGGIYRVKYRRVLKRDTPQPQIEGGIDKAGSCDAYDLALDDPLSDLIGKLFIDWGPGKLAWIQKPKNKNKSVTELRTAFHEDPFPGFLNFIQPLSKLDKFPGAWTTALTNSRGVYLFTCPKTRELYVGSASGEKGFWGRWQGYIQTGHGGNVALKSRELSDYQVSILEVAGTSATPEDIKAMEGRWQRKFQSREMGLNRNLAGSA